MVNEQTKETTDLIKAQQVGQNISNDTQKELLKWIPQEKILNFYSKTAEIVQMGLNHQLTHQQIRNLVAQEFNIMADTDRLKALTDNIEANTDMVKLDYNAKKKVIDKVLDSYIQQLEFQFELETIINQGGIKYFNGDPSVDVPYKTFEKLYGKGHKNTFFHKNMFDYWKTRGTRPKTTSFNLGGNYRKIGINGGFSITE